MSNLVIGNAIDYALGDECRTLLHCVNSKRVMGSGVAKEIRGRIPEAYTAYMSNCKLGGISYTKDRKVINLCAQENYGYDGKKYVSYAHLAECLKQVNLVCPIGTEYVVPYGMCSALAGGDWEAVQVIVDLVLGSDNVTYVKLT